MSLLRRLAGLLGRPEGNGPSDAPPPAAKGREVRRAPRVRTDTLGNIRIEANFDSKISPIPIQNLSTTGAGLVRSALARWPQRGESFSGELVYDEERIPLTLQVVHISPTFVGVTFERPSTEIRRLLDKYFRIEISALELRPVRPEALKADPEGQPQWLTGPGHSELYYIRSKEGSITRMEITLFGNQLKIARDGSAIYEGAGEAEPLSTPPSEMLEAYLKLVDSLDSVSSDDKSALSALLRPI